MDLLPEDLAFIRTYVVWTPPTDDDIAARYDELYTERIRNPYYTGTYDPYLLAKQIRVITAEAYVRTRLALMLDQPDAFNVEGDYSESWRGNPQFLTAFLDELQKMSADSGFSVGQLTRADALRDNVDPFAQIDPYRGGHGLR